MKKSIDPLSQYCPQTLYAYGSNKEDGTPNFGLFSWLSGYFDKEMGVMVCLSGDKITKDRIHATNVFSANLLTEQLLPFADYCGFTEGYDERKMQVPIEVERGHVLDVPILAKSPWVYELEVDKSIVMEDGEVFFCKIKNVLADEVLCDDSLSIEQRMNTIKPVHTVDQTYFNWNGTAAGDWKTLMENVQTNTLRGVL